SLREGLARVLPQALIAARPVISYDIDGAREVVLPGETGFLLPPCSVAEMAEAILQLAADPQMRERLGQTGRAKFTDQFRHEPMTRQLREISEQVITNSRRDAMHATQPRDRSPPSQGGAGGVG